MTLRDLEYVDVRVHLVQELWPLRDGTSRRRVYDAIREAQLVVDQILYIILTPELSCELKPVDFVSGGTLEGKRVDEEAFTEELIRVAKTQNKLNIFKSNIL